MLLDTNFAIKKNFCECLMLTEFYLNLFLTNISKKLYLMLKKAML